MGEGPRYFGRIEGCILSDPSLGIAKSSFGNIFPKAATMKMSGFCFLKKDSSEELNLSNCLIEIFFLMASFLTAEMTVSCFLPTGLSFPVITVLIETFLSNSLLKISLENEGVPQKNIFKLFDFFIDFLGARENG